MCVCVDGLGAGLLGDGAEDLWRILGDGRAGGLRAGEEGRAVPDRPQQELARGHQVAVAARVGEGVARAACADSPRLEAAWSGGGRGFVLSDFVPHLHRTMQLSVKHT